MKQLKYVFIMFVSYISKAPCYEGIMSCIYGQNPQNTVARDMQEQAGEFQLKLTLLSGTTGNTVSYRTAEACSDALKYCPSQVFRKAFPEFNLECDTKPLYIFKDTGEKITQDTESGIFQRGINDIEVVLQPRFRPEGVSLIIEDPNPTPNGEIIRTELDFYNLRQTLNDFCKNGWRRAKDRGNRQVTFWLYINVHGDILRYIEPIIAFRYRKYVPRILRYLSNVDNQDYIEEMLRQSFSAFSLIDGLLSIMHTSKSARTMSFIMTQCYKQDVRNRFGHGDESMRRIREFEELIARVRANRYR